jgi:regulator of protease activity HflC (stomatin/prohibitin superfamily)
LFAALKVLKEYERGVIFRLGRAIGAKGPGLIILIPLIDRMVKVSLRTVAMDVAPQDVITKDNVSVKVNAVVYFRVMDPTKAVIQVEDYLYATSQLAQTTLRSVCGQSDLDDLCQRAREDQQPAAGDPGPAHRRLGHQGQHRGSQAHRPAP